MDLRQLRYFIAVAEELHFGRVATRLFISQPVLSFDIKKLEEQLGTQLLLRNNRSAKPTGAGQVLLVEAHNPLLQAEKVKRLTQLSVEDDVGQLRVDFVNFMLHCGLPRVMSRFEREHPNMEAVLSGTNSVEQAQVLQCGQIDLGFTYWGRLPAEIVSEPLVSDSFLCHLLVEHRLTSQARLNLAELRDEDFTLFPCHVSSHYHDLITARCVDAGLNPYVRHEARLQQIITVTAGLGMGVALIPETFCLAWRNEVRYLEIKPAGVRSETRATLPVSELSRAAQAFLAMLKSGPSDIWAKTDGKRQYEIPYRATRLEDH